jgi:hypothetical protein
MPGRRPSIAQEGRYERASGPAQQHTLSIMARITTGTGSIVAQTFALYGRPS